MEYNTMMTFEEKLKKVFGNMLVYKSSEKTKFFSALSIPSFMRDWLVMRFSDSEGNINEEEVLNYVKRTIPKKDQWNGFLVDMLHGNKSVRFLTKVKIDFDTKKKQALFSLPVFDVPSHKGDAVVEWGVIEKNRDYLLSPTEVWGIVEIQSELDPNGKNYIFKLINFTPFCPYKIDLKYSLFLVLT